MLNVYHNHSIDCYSFSTTIIIIIKIILLPKSHGIPIFRLRMEIRRVVIELWCDNGENKARLHSNACKLIAYTLQIYLNNRQDNPSQFIKTIRSAIAHISPELQNHTHVFFMRNQIRGCLSEVTADGRPQTSSQVKVQDVRSDGSPYSQWLDLSLIWYYLCKNIPFYVKISHSTENVGNENCNST